MTEQLKLSPIIRNLVPTLPERGKIKIGEKGRMVTSKNGAQFQPPAKLDHFKIVTLQRGQDGNFLLDREAHQHFGERPTRLPIFLLYDALELNFTCRYSCYQGTTVFCYGDGEQALQMTGRKGPDGGDERSVVQCPCHRQAPTYAGKDKCKINGVLSVLLDGVGGVGGVYKLRTTSWNTVNGILSSLALVQRITGGPLAGIPLQMVLHPKTVVVPTTGQSMAAWIVGVEYAGTAMELQDRGYQIALGRATHGAKIERIEEDARRMLTASIATVAYDDDPEDVAAEFYPDQYKVAHAADGTAYNAKTGEVATPPPAGNAPDEQAQTDRQAPARRSRRNTFTDADGVEVKTCGVTPEQIQSIRAHAKIDKGYLAGVKEFLATLGVDDLTFLRAEEAEELVGYIPTEPNEEPPLPEAEYPVGEDDDLMGHMLGDEA